MSLFSRFRRRPSEPALQPTALVVGLGNPGPDYVGTRHNAGFEVVDRLADRLGLEMSAEAGFSVVAVGPLPPPEPAETAADSPESSDSPADDASAAGAAEASAPVLALATPLTFMNRSGRAVGALLDRYGLGPDDLLVVYDDLALPIGALRLRGKGSHAGHNGVRDIIQTLGSDEFPRLRVGIGNSFPPGGQVDFVLSPFADDERDAADDAFDEAARAALTFARDGLTAAMNQHNRR